MRLLTAVASAMLLTTAIAGAQTPSGNEGQTNRGAQPVDPGAQSGSSALPDSPTDPNTGFGSPPASEPDYDPPSEPDYDPPGADDDDDDDELAASDTPTGTPDD